MANKKIYTVSFGDSNIYRVIYAPDSPAESTLSFDDVEKRLADALRKEFPSVDSLAYFTTPKVHEVTDGEDVSAFPPLNDKAVDDIRHTLEIGIRDMLANKLLNSNAPFNDVPPKF